MCEKCEAKRKVPLTPEEIAEMKREIDVVFERVRKHLPAAAANTIRSLAAMAGMHEDVVTQTDSRRIGAELLLFSLASVYCAYWALADTCFHEAAVQHLRARLKEATPTLMAEVRAAVDAPLAGSTVIAFTLPEGVIPAPPVDPKTLN